MINACPDLHWYGFGSGSYRYLTWSNTPVRSNSGPVYVDLCGSGSGILSFCFKIFDFLDFFYFFLPGTVQTSQHCDFHLRVPRSDPASSKNVNEGHKAIALPCFPLINVLWGHQYGNRTSHFLYENKIFSIFISDYNFSCIICSQSFWSFGCWVQM